MILLLNAALTGPCTAASERSTMDPGPRTNVLLLTVDTLRADALHCYGFPVATTPNIDALAQRGVRFADALTPIGKTGPAFSSLFSSLYPPSHGARRNGVPIRQDVPLLAEILTASGFQTAAFISNWTLRRKLAGLDRGFEHFDEEFDRKRYAFGAAERDADSVNAAVLKWLDSSRDVKRPLFLWVHFSEPHSPYVEHQGFTVPLDRSEQAPELWQKRLRYASEVAFTDDAIGRLVAGLNSRLDLEKTLVVFVADHGESFGEHDYWGHGKNAHWPNLRIPMIWAGPGLPSGKVLRGPTSLLDVTPSILAMLKIETGAVFQGMDISSSVWSDLPSERELFSFGDRHTAFRKRARRTYEDPLQIALETATQKVLYDFLTKQTSYYDLVLDPLELKSLREAPHETRPPLRRKLADWYRQLPKFEARSGELDDEDFRQLETLGYVGAP